MKQSLISWLGDSLTIAHRDILRAIRQKSNLIGGLARPVIWLFLLGTGLRNGFTGLPTGVDLLQYTFPGIIAMNILFTGIMSGASIIWDREFGFLKAVQVAPVAWSAVICGKITSGSMLATFQGLIVLFFFPFLQIGLSVHQVIYTVLAMILVAVAVTSIGVLLASRLDSIEGFGTIQNFVAMPMFVLSGALYPATNIPEWLKMVMYLNPFTYGVDLLRGIVLGYYHYVWFDIGEILLFTSLGLGSAGYFFRKKG